MNNRHGISGMAGLRSVMVTLATAVCLAGLYYGFVRIKDTITSAPKQDRLYYKKVTHFTEAEKAAFLTNHAGLWQFDFQIVDNGRIVSKKDRIEIKENGIVWQYVLWEIPMPDGEVGRFSQVRTAFLKPFGIVRGDSACDAFTLMQSFTSGADTIFGAWNYPELWSFRKDGATLMLNRRNYSSYRGDPAGFFPPGAVDFVQSAESQFFKDSSNEIKINQLYTVSKVDQNTGTVRLIRVNDSIADLSDLLKRHLAAAFRTGDRSAATKESLAAAIARYYDPFVVIEELRVFPRQLPKSLSLSLVVKPDGSTDSVAVISRSPDDSMLKQSMEKEVSAWFFPAPPQPERVVYEFAMP